MPDQPTTRRNGYVVTVRAMFADPVTCSYDPARGGSETVTRYWQRGGSIEPTVHRLTGRGLYAQGHSVTGRETTVHNPAGGRWDCFKVSIAPAELDTGAAHGPAPAPTERALLAEWHRGETDAAAYLRRDAINRALAAIYARRAAIYARRAERVALRRRANADAAAMRAAGYGS